MEKRPVNKRYAEALICRAILWPFLRCDRTLVPYASAKLHATTSGAVMYRLGSSKLSTLGISMFRVVMASVARMPDATITAVISNRSRSPQVKARPAKDGGSASRNDTPVNMTVRMVASTPNSTVARVVKG